jgi:hypothetical protein
MTPATFPMWNEKARIYKSFQIAARVRVAGLLFLLPSNTVSTSF